MSVHINPVSMALPLVNPDFLPNPDYMHHISACFVKSDLEVNPDLRMSWKQSYCRYCEGDVFD